MDRNLHDQPTIDHRVVDWSLAERAVYRVWQKYRYTYSGPVRDVRQCLVMIPPDIHNDQRLIQHEIAVHGTVDDVVIRWGFDQFGNRRCWIDISQVQDTLEFVAQYDVERPGAPGGALNQGDSVWGMRGFLRTTPLTLPDERLLHAAASIARQTTVDSERADLASEWVSDALSYRYGITSWNTPAVTALDLGYGVCQDFTHVLLSLLRLLGIPARYASGHLLGEGAPHAWVEAACDDVDQTGAIQFLGYDPTHRRRCDAKYITVATGRDFADISPTSGTYRGRGSGVLSYEKRAELIEVVGAGAIRGGGVEPAP